MENIFFFFFQIHLILGMADYALTLTPVDLLILLVGAKIFLSLLICNSLT